MSELANEREHRATIRWQLLTTVSAVALLALVYDDNGACAADADRPTVWIELGGQLEQVDGLGDKFAPPFLFVKPTPGPYTHGSPLDVENAAKNSLGPELKISVQPEDSDWVFSASVRYGRSNSSKSLHKQTAIPHLPETEGSGPLYPGFGLPTGNFVDATDPQRESHAILDFMAGKDVGLGIGGSTSVFSAGVRFAQFITSSKFNIHARPDTQFYNGFAQFGLPPPKYFPAAHYHSFGATGISSRSFHGIGPSVSWNASLPFAGTPNAVEFAVDWGANASMLFGRQKATVKHQTSAVYYKPNVLSGPKTYPVYHNAPPAQNRIRSVVVPNAGAFAGVSLKFPSAKFSLGYRGDFFFGAIDGGIGTAKKEARGFYGPFATVSIGLGG